MQYLIQGGILDDRQFKYIKYCFSKDAPFSIEQKTEYRKTYYCPLLAEVFRCSTFREYAQLKGFAEPDNSLNYEN